MAQIIDNPLVVKCSFREDSAVWVEDDSRAALGGLLAFLDWSQRNAALVILAIDITVLTNFGVQFS